MMNCRHSTRAYGKDLKSRNAFGDSRLGIDRNLNTMLIIDLTFYSAIELKCCFSLGFKGSLMQSHKPSGEGVRDSGTLFQFKVPSGRTIDSWSL